MTKQKKKTYPHSKSYPVLLLIIFTTSCSWQFETSHPYERSGSSQLYSITTAKHTSAGEGQSGSQTYQDPLFFIDGQLCQHVRTIFQDRNGNLWFGTNIYGLMRYDGDTLEYFSEKDGLGGGRINSIVEDKEGNVWFSTFKGLTKYDGNVFTNYNVADGPVHNDVWSIVIDRKGLFWLGTVEGVIQFDGQKSSYFPIPKKAVTDTTSILSYDRVSCIMEDKNGNLWFGTDGFGICKYDPSKGQSGFTLFTKADGLPGNNIYDLMEDSEGNIWIGTMYGGVSRYHGKRFTNYTQDGVIEGIEVGGFFEDKHGNIWFAAENFGVYRYDGSTFTNFDSEDGLNTNGILCIFEDKEGRFWMGGWGGLFRYDPTAEESSDKSFFPVTKDGPWE
jgi:ligand-binding sensor domain-containing protein